MEYKTTIKPYRRSNFQDKYVWLDNNKARIEGLSLHEIFELMQKEGLYSNTYAYRDAATALERRVNEIRNNLPSKRNK